MPLMDRTPPRTGWTLYEADGSMLGLFGTCGRLQEPQEGQRFAFRMLVMPKKGQRLPQRGLTSPFLAHNFGILAFNVTNNVILLVILVGCFNDLFL